VRSERPPKAPDRSSHAGRSHPAGSSGLAYRLELREALLSVFRSPSYKPPILPVVALELTNLTRKSTVSYEEVVQVVAKDPLLVANVLKLAQSPMYGGRLRAHSLQEALSRVGISTLRDMVWQVAVGMRIFRVPGYASTMERLLAHSTFTAYAARAVAAELGLPQEQAFLCGLLHDVGWSGTLVTVGESVPKPPSPEALFAVIDKMHAEAGQAMLTLWGLSPEIVEVVGHHHDIADQTLAPLVMVLCVAEQLADEFDFAIEPQKAAGPTAARVDENLVGRFEQAVAHLQLAGKLDALRNGATKLAERLRAADALIE
jgi:putative nucleotidyltransferase with HDIG domain